MNWKWTNVQLKMNQELTESALEVNLNLTKV
jgi:hypothetical protein